MVHKSKKWLPRHISPEDNHFRMPLEKEHFSKNVCDKNSGVNTQDMSCFYVQPAFFGKNKGTLFIKLDDIFSGKSLLKQKIGAYLNKT